ncbi:agc/akt protein kinase [Fusarium flagelliforme]|uniref:Agc/akt protein kinase n=1 Tax=Fusarium flagelliforme TaxID=2675880 RepID=A0A395N7H5_9HYPO|nr:agc/akt protein kinase [Fusarium flagelliforme]
MTGTETSNAGGGFDLLRRATQAMMSSASLRCWHWGPSPSTGGSGGGDRTMTAFQHPELSTSASSGFSNASPVKPSQVLFRLELSTTPSPWSTTPPTERTHLISHENGTASGASTGAHAGLDSTFGRCWAQFSGQSPCNCSAAQDDEVSTAWQVESMDSP